MKWCRSLWLVLLVLLLAGCVSASGSYSAPALDESEEYSDDYGYDKDVSDLYVLKENAVDYAWENNRDTIIDYIVESYSARDLFEDELEDAVAEAYLEGYDAAINGDEPEYSRPVDEPEETVVEGQDANGPLIFTISDNGDPMDHYTEEAKAGELAETETVNYIANTNTGKIHYPNCSSVNDMKEKNKLYWTGTRDELIDKGYVPCQRCNP